ncbi:hypothetical protein IGI04_017111 [Brassica rapa subsp. trilocularis]|uniref:Uncharacterized protein n=1 Tax=Brassica rapa subsp. trilocularis TaxID=1813537 RepID=A0ABQ7MUX5_BRACM|nr:hypothetical protein IGI04_017111 [Brassica rapa subsp. trilocularis]
MKRFHPTSNVEQSNLSITDYRVCRCRTEASLKNKQKLKKKSKNKKTWRSRGRSGKSSRALTRGKSPAWQHMVPSDHTRAA